MAVHGFGVDAARAADAAQVGEQPLKSRLDFFCVVVRLFEAQTFEGETWACETLCNLFFGFIVGEDNDLNARGEQSRDDLALQEIDDCHAVVGGDEDFFSHVV